MILLQTNYRYLYSLHCFEENNANPYPEEIKPIRIPRK